MGKPGGGGEGGIVRGAYPILYLDIIIISLFRDKKFEKEDAFIGYQKDTPAAAVFQATNQMEKLCQGHPSTVQKWIEVLKSGLLGFTLDNVTDEMALDQYNEKVRSLL